ncbi:MAG TPA: DUF58 domain-containing protein [bacterium]
MPPSSGTSSGPPPSAEPAGVPLAAGDLRIRLTAPGGFAIALVLAAGVVAVNSGNNLLYFVVASLLALLALSGILGHRNLAAASVRLLPPDEAWAGRPASVRVLLAAGPGRASYLLAVGEAGKPPAAVAAEVPRGGATDVPLAVSFPARGVQPWPALEISSEFPFGLIRRGRVVRPRGGCLVYPQPLPVSWESVDRAEREGELATRRKAGLGGDYRGLRDYVPGDAIARVQWTSWLRLRRLLTKEFESEGAPPVVYAFDAVPGPGTEARLGQLAWLVRTALRRGRAAGLELPGQTFAPGSGQAHRRALLGALARFPGPT